MTFIDLPIRGEKTRGAERSPQRPREELETKLRAMLDFPEVVGLKWTQYTPYFNDGDPCIFHTGELYYRFIDTPEGEGDYEDGYVSNYDESFKRSVGEYEYQGEWPDRKKVYVNPPNPLLAETVEALGEAFGSGAHEDLLLELFGDHAEIIATREGFEVDFYEHD